MKIKKNKIFRLIIILIFILIILVLMIRFLEKQPSFQVDDYDNLKYVNLNENETLEEDIIIPEDSIEFFKDYTGKIKSKDIYESIYKFSKYTVPKYKNELKDVSLLEYYNSNRDTIEEEFGIKEKNQFINLMEKIRNIKENELNLVKIKFDKNQITREKEGTSASIIITYNENINIKIDVYVHNKEQEKTSIIFN